jgi:hypothetical protein
MASCGLVWPRMASYGLVWPRLASYGLGVTSVSNRKENQLFSGGINGDRRVPLRTIPPSVGGVSRPCGSLDGSQIYRPPWPATQTVYKPSSFVTEHGYFVIIKLAC